MPVQVIPPMQQTASEARTGIILPSARPKIRVAAYCRVSTELEEQESSYEAQIAHYTGFINANDSWALAGIYADEGLSGTQTKKRDEFNRMIKDCEDGRIDMVITKSISRFARNTLDCLQYIRKLKDLNIPILFEKENINTMDSSGEMLITIMASIAQQESLSISQNVRMGIQYKFQQGKPVLQHNWFLGYTKDENGNLKIVPEEADVVRRIFREYLEGLTIAEIGSRLEADGIKTGAGRTTWYYSTIMSMLRNEKHMGDLILQKYYTADFLTKKKMTNDGVFPKYYVENAHDPIVPREVFMQVQGEILRRENVRLTTGKGVRLLRGEPLNTRIICSECGNAYRRFLRNDKPHLTSWRCKLRVQKGAPCRGRTIKDLALKEAIVIAMNRVTEKRGELEEMQEKIRSSPLKEIKKGLEIINNEEKRLRNMISVWTESDANDINDSDAVEQASKELKTARKRKEELMCRKAEYDIQNVNIRLLLELIDDIEGNERPPYIPESPACRDYADFFERTRQNDHHGPVTEYSGDDVTHYIDHITIYPDRMSMVFKAGVVVDVEK